jgi:hypothetical protein
MEAPPTLLRLAYRSGLVPAGLAFVIGYRFVTRQGAALDGRNEVGVDQWETLNLGEPVEVDNLPTSPTMTRAAATSEWPLAIGFTALGAFVALVGEAMLVGGARAVQAAKYPLHHGRRCDGGKESPSAAAGAVKNVEGEGVAQGDRPVDARAAWWRGCRRHDGVRLRSPRSLKNS